jgi:hypothetical protein
MWVVDVEFGRIGSQVDAGYDTCLLNTSGTSGRKSRTCEPYREGIEAGDGILRMLCWAP